MRFHRALAWLLILPLFLLGCSKGPKLASVSGRVTMDQKPLANADVTFVPESSDSGDPATLESSGMTDDQGKFSLKMNKDNRNGAIIGSHKVRISLIERGAKIENRVPKQYNKNTTLTFTVPPGGSKEANFDLKSQGN
jgi:hypothetical protein